MVTLFTLYRLECYMALLQQQSKELQQLYNPKLNHSKSFKIKTLLNDLSTHSHLHTIFPNTFSSANCFECRMPDSSSHWRTCQNLSLINQIVLTAILEVVRSSDLELPDSQYNSLTQLIYTHPSFNPTPTFLYPYSLDSTLKGLIPTPLIQTVQSPDISYKQASQIIIKSLLKVSEEAYEQIWKLYCSALAHWKKTNNICSEHNRPKPTQLRPSRKNRHSKKNFTYTC